jgi:hypothetical protein
MGMEGSAGSVKTGFFGYWSDKKGNKRGGKNGQNKNGRPKGRPS